MILALDQGTTSSRAIVFDSDGAIRAVAQREFTQIYPKPGWVEHDPEEIWSTQLAVAHEAISKAGVQTRDIAAIGITNQRETTVVWERATGKPIHNAIVWQDRRTAAACAALKGKPIHNAIVWQDRRTAAACAALKARGLEAAITARTGLLADAYFSGSKIAWILDHVPGARTRAAAGELAFGTIDSWLIWKLTNGAAHVTDITNASRTLLFNIITGSWDDELLLWLNVPRQVLPQVCASSGILAETAPGLFDTRIPIAGIAGDQQAALFGQRCTQPGMAKNTYGTGCFMLMHTGGKVIHSPSRLLGTAACATDKAKQYALEGSVFIGRAACSSAARWCNGCATAWASSVNQAKSKHWRTALLIMAASIWCRLSPDSAHRIGSHTPAAPSWALRGVHQREISRALHWKALPTKQLMCCRPWSQIQALR